MRSNRRPGTLCARSPAAWSELVAGSRLVGPYITWKLLVGPARGTCDWWCRLGVRRAPLVVAGRQLAGDRLRRGDDGVLGAPGLGTPSGWDLPVPLAGL